MSNIWNLLDPKFVRCAPSQSACRAPVKDVVRPGDCFCPKKVTVHLDEGTVLTLSHPISFRIVWDGESSLDPIKLGIYLPSQLSDWKKITLFFLCLQLLEIPLLHFFAEENILGITLLRHQLGRGTIVHLRSMGPRLVRKRRKESACLVPSSYRSFWAKRPVPFCLEDRSHYVLLQCFS